jgi:hypothetical protein
MPHLITLFLFFGCTLYAQTINDPIAFDGNVTEEEWAKAQKFEIINSITPFLFD